MTISNGLFEWINCERSLLPNVDRLRDARAYVYLYDPRPERYGYRVAAWTQGSGEGCRRFVYDTGGIEVTNPDGFHEEVERRIQATKRPRAEVVREVIEETWPETYRELLAVRASQAPVRNEDVEIPAAELKALLDRADAAGVAEAVQQPPEGFGGFSARVLIRNGRGQENDLVGTYYTTSAGLGRFISTAWRVAGYRA